MGVGELGSKGCTSFRTVSPSQVPKYMLAPELALFLAIDFDCFLQNMASATGAREEDEVTYYVNRDSAGWVEQRVRRRVYIELKLECTRNRCRENQKARDDWLCLYCRASFPSKLRLTDHRVGGCPCGPVDSRGVKWELPVYPNLKTAKQGKDLKLALQRGEGSIWGSLGDDSVWLDLNPELKDLIYPPLGARVQVRKFFLPSIATLQATPAHPRDVRPQAKSTSQRPPKHQPASQEGEFVVLEDDDDEQDPETPPSRPKKRPHAQMEEGQRPYFTSRAFKVSPRKVAPMPQAERHSQHPPRSTRQPCSDGSQRRPPPHPIRVAPIQSRSPSPERAVILHPPTQFPMPHVPPTPSPMPPSMNDSPSSQDRATCLRKDRQAFYVKVASGAQASVKMDTPKPALRPPIQPPGLYFLIACGLLNLDLEFGEFQGFEGEVNKWVKDPHFLDRLYAAYGRFCSPVHQVLPTPEFSMCL